MKKLIIASTLFLTGISTAQTDVISAKSHSTNDLATIEHESSNFGLDDRMMTKVDSVIYLGGNCYLQVSHDYRGVSRDTICENYYFEEHGFTYEVISNSYIDNPVIIGFPKGKNKIQDSLYWQIKNDNSTFFWIALLIGGISLLIPVFKSKL